MLAALTGSRRLYKHRITIETGLFGRLELSFPNLKHSLSPLLPKQPFENFFTFRGITPETKRFLELLVAFPVLWLPGVHFRRR
jgi:hypothetical protein